MKEVIVSHRRCPSCGKKTILTDENSGELFCGSCGFVITDKLEDTGAEWRSFSQDETNRARTGAGTSLTMHDMGLSTVIGAANKDATGKPLSASMKSSIERLRTWDSRTQAHSSSERNLRQALNEMDKIKDKLALTDSVIEKAAYIYRKALDKKLVQGRSITAIMASALYAACRNAETPRTLKDIADVINIPKGSIADVYRVLVKELDLRIPVVDPAQCVAKIASKIRISEKTKRYAIKIIRKSQQEGIAAGKDPMGLAAAALYLGCVKTGEFHTQQQLAIAANITEVTIRNRCKGLRTLNPKNYEGVLNW